jgi:hypothetical protein
LLLQRGSNLFIKEIFRVKRGDFPLSEAALPPEWRILKAVVLGKTAEPTVLPDGALLPPILDIRRVGGKYLELGSAVFHGFIWVTQRDVDAPLVVRQLTLVDGDRLLLLDRREAFVLDGHAALDLLHYLPHLDLLRYLLIFALELKSLQLLGESLFEC